MKNRGRPRDRERGGRQGEPRTTLPRRQLLRGQRGEDLEATSGKYRSVYACQNYTLIQICYRLISVLKTRNVYRCQHPTIYWSGSGRYSVNKTFFVQENWRFWKKWRITRNQMRMRRIQVSGSGLKNNGAVSTSKKYKHGSGSLIKWALHFTTQLIIRFYLSCSESVQF